MRTERWGVAAACLLLAACGGPPATGPANDEGSARQVLQVDGRLYPDRAIGSSIQAFGSQAYSASRAIDGNQDQEWASADGESDPSLVLEFNSRQDFGRVRIKTWPGSNFRFEVSDDNVNWTSASGTVSNSSWQMEEKSVYGAGRYLRVRFQNPPPSGVKHFSVFEIEAFGRGGGGGGGYPPPPLPPPISAESLSFVNLEDRIGTGTPTADGTGDGHLRLQLNLSQPIEIRTMELYELEPGTRTGTGYIWSTVYSSRWLLGVVGPNIPSILGYRSSLGTFPAGSHTFDLYAAEPSNVFSGRGKLLQVIVSFGDGTTRSIEGYPPR